VTCNGAVNYCDQTLTPLADNFIARFNVAGIPTGIRDSKRLPEGSVWVYPNPIEQELHINLFAEINAPGPGSLRLVNPIGQMVQEKNIKVQPGLNQLQLSTGHLASGIYFLHITTEAGEQVSKIVKR
jgi:hypothetical protein